MFTIDTCPVCEIKGTRNNDHAGSWTIEVVCERCGNFALSTYWLDNLIIPVYGGANWRAQMSHWIRIHQSDDLKQVQVTDENLIKDILDNHPLPKPQERENNLILWLGRETTRGNSSVAIKKVVLASMIGAENEENVEEIIQSLKSIDSLEILNETIKDEYSEVELRLKHEGQKRFENLNSDSNN